MLQFATEPVKALTIQTAICHHPLVQDLYQWFVQSVLAFINVFRVGLYALVVVLRTQPTQLCFEGEHYREMLLSFVVSFVNFRPIDTSKLLALLFAQNLEFDVRLFHILEWDRELLLKAFDQF